MTNPRRARLDTDRTAKPLTSIVAHVAKTAHVGGTVVAGPGIEYVAEDGTRTPLDGAARRRSVAQDIAEVLCPGGAEDVAWDSSTLDAVRDVLLRAGVGPRSLIAESPEAVRFYAVEERTTEEIGEPTTEVLALDATTMDEAVAEAQGLAGFTTTGLRVLAVVEERVVSVDREAM